MTRTLLALILTTAAANAGEDVPNVDLTTAEIARALDGQGVRRASGSIERVQGLFQHAVGAQLQLEDRGQTSGSVVKQDAVEIASALDLNTRESSPAIARAIRGVAATVRRSGRWAQVKFGEYGWHDYFSRTANLYGDGHAMELFARYGYQPVQVSWEDIGRDEGSVWGSRISDVMIWGREKKGDLSTARPLLTVRRDENFRDNVLLVPAQNIKLHRRVEGRFEEVTLPDRLAELGLVSKGGRFDKNVIVSNEFSIVPVPRKEHAGVDALDFNFSVFPYGSTNYVIADTIEGSSDVVVGGDQTQLIYFDAQGKKAPFTAARASDRPDVVAAAAEMRQAGLDVDVQRFYLIQVPLKHEARGVHPGSMGTPPMQGYYAVADMEAPFEGAGGAPSAQQEDRATVGRGLEQVVVGHGDEEGAYEVGTGFRGQRADERVRVTVCYFVTPRGQLSDADMKTFANKFKEWDGKAIWGGSFVLPNAVAVSQK